MNLPQSRIDSILTDLREIVGRIQALQSDEFVKSEANANRLDHAFGNADRAISNLEHIDCSDLSGCETKQEVSERKGWSEV